ncbi:Protein CBR-VHA-6 [Caenorhabditis briggsae]|uniref:V-type proton ATPase subunit a n=1 Tax=Caenorhabditis briggsae TaxID=6238 RepID=A8WT97_CAEBR|nr:Protein CBR-VHA-6 [Caenorhabditis briggsae]CAP23708.1 Protein CBR-VHA-6 [Caenorhabditis briggsae]
MGSIYRSEHMKLCQIFFQSESAYQCVAELGELGMAQFIDLNEEQNSYQRKFVNEVRRCEEMDRKITFVEDEINKDLVPIPDYNDHIPAPQPKHMGEMEANLEKLEEELLQINKNTKTLKTNHIQLLEMKAVLEHVTSLMDHQSKREAAMSISEAARGEAGPFSVGLKQEFDKPVRDENELKFVTGVIKRAKSIAFERFLWRLSRAKVFAKFVQIQEKTDLFSHEYEDKCVFILFFSGEQLRSKVKKICDGFQAKCYTVPENPAERTKLLNNIKIQANDMKAVIEKTLDYRAKCIHTAAGNLRKWGIMLLKVKSIFHTLNMFSVDVTQKCLIAECWVPEADIAQVKNSLHMGTIHSGSSVPAILNEMETEKYPPTYFKLNKFTQGFQNIVDAYGIASYREVNPAPWTIISFPFLFAVMFGDAGHGIIMLLAAAGFVIFEKKLISMKIKDEIFNTFFGGRYVVLLMGMFAIYTGLIYNDFYSKSINMFGSSWTNPYPKSLLEQMDKQGAESKTELSLTFPPENAFDHGYGPYPFGVDPVWNLATNRLNFLNPMKMKTSILLGISQMAFGILLSLMNHIGNRSVVDIIFVFIPQCLFLGCIFVYLCLQVIMKWIFFYVKPAIIFGKFYPGSNCAPSLLIGLINMFMVKSRDPTFAFDINNGKGKYNATLDDGTKYTYTDYDQCYLQQWYPNQSLVEIILLLIAVVSVPVMLLVKPFYIRWRHSRGLPVDLGHGPEDEHGEFNFGDVMVHQAIHTIEFVLGCVSHTASYLRLWALSLAHAQLSDVLWTMVLRMSLKMGGWGGSAAVTIIFYFIFSILSVCILILMEGLSAFLHAIRLHWVEFQSKFYGGTGIQFEPFSFTKIIRVYEGLDQ